MSNDQVDMSFLQQKGVKELLGLEHRDRMMSYKDKMNGIRRHEQFQSALTGYTNQKEASEEQMANPDSQG